MPSFLQFLRSFICTSSSLSSLPVLSRLSDETRSTDENADRIRPAAQPQNENHNRCSAYSTSPAFLRFRSYSCPYRPPSDVPTIFSLRVENQGEGPRWRGESHHINMASSINTCVLFLTCISASVLSRTGCSPAPAIRPIYTPGASSNKVLCRTAR
jgi:hypothetical protein